jgi:transposase-like protein
MNLAQVTTLNEEQARDYLESIRWPNRPVCPHCASQAVVKLQGKSTRPGVYKCKNKDCRKQFTVTVGTIFERSHIPLRHWVIAFHMMASSKKGVSAHQIHRSVGCTGFVMLWSKGLWMVPSSQARLKSTKRMLAASPVVAPRAVSDVAPRKPR